jgi:hypothetical protein
MVKDFTLQIGVQILVPSSYMPPRFLGEYNEGSLPRKRLSD